MLYHGKYSWVVSIWIESWRPWQGERLSNL